MQYTGIDTDDEGDKSNNENSSIGSKSKYKSSSVAQNKKQRPNKVPKKNKCCTKTGVVVSNDDQLDLEEMADTDVENSEDQADAYKKLRLECKNEHPV